MPLLLSIVKLTTSIPLSVPVGSIPPCQFIVCDAPPICTAVGINSLAPCTSTRLTVVAYADSSCKLVKFAVTSALILV